MSIYAFSRAIYRELAEEIVEDPHVDRHVNHARVLRACEAALERLATDRRYFGRPAKSLFCEIRMHFPMASQERVLRVIEHFLAMADEYLQRLPQNGLDANGNPLQCRASTRRGTPCQRMPHAHNGYCPSHQHLAQTEDLPSPIAA